MASSMLPQSGHHLWWVYQIRKKEKWITAITIHLSMAWWCASHQPREPKLRDSYSLLHRLESEYGVKTRVIDVDFTGGREIYDRIDPQLQDLDIGVLVNNVGMSYNFPEFLNVLPDASDVCTRLMHCNILSVTGMTLLVMPKMAEKRRGLILNVSSASAVLPSPLLTLYGSTKVSNHILSSYCGKARQIEKNLFNTNLRTSRRKWKVVRTYGWRGISPR